jgi:hypothetical protein
MKKNAKVGLILGVGALVAAISYYFLIYKPSKGNTTVVPPAAGGNTNIGNTTGGAAATGGVIGSLPLIGKNLYAKQDGVKEVFSNGQVRKIGRKDEWMGMAYAEENLGGSKFYRVGTNTYVAASLVYAK